MPNVKPFVSSRPSGPVFVGLNILRSLSIISLLLVFSANIVTMGDDIKAIRANHMPSPDEVDCDYIEYTTVPDQTGGAFWSILNRILIIFECILLTLSEIGVPKMLFESFIPVLGPQHGLGCLGVFEALIGTQVLSHHSDLFPQVTSWLLFIVGGFNIIAGIFLRSGGKKKRLIFSWENVSSSTSRTRLAVAGWDMVTEKRHPPAAAPVTRQTSDHSDGPLLPEAPTAPGARFGGFGFGRQGERVAADRGWKISKPVESLPRHAV